MANFNFEYFSSGYPKSELMGAHGWGFRAPAVQKLIIKAQESRTSKIDPAYTQITGNKSRRLKEETKMISWLTEVKALQASWKNVGGDYPAIIAGVQRLRALKTAFMGLRRLDVPDHDKGVNLIKSAYYQAGTVWAKFVGATIRQMAPVLKSQDFNQLSSSLSQFESFKAQAGSIPQEIKNSPAYMNGISQMAAFKTNLKKAIVKAEGTQAEYAQITAAAKGQTQAMLEFEKNQTQGGDEGGMGNLAMPLMLGAGALTLILALKG